MRPSIAAIRAPLLAALALLGACAAPPPPLLDISTRVCPAAPDLIGARAVALDDPLHPHPLVVRVDEHAACVDTTVGKSAYVSFQLPDSAQPYMIAVRSAPLGAGLFVPRLMLFDGAGQLKREVPRDSFVFRGDTLTLLMRSRGDERYLVVASTPQAVGQTTTRISEYAWQNCNNTSCAAAGRDVERTIVYAHGGVIGVYAAAIPADSQTQ